jgi:hypothetical protein
VSSIREGAMTVLDANVVPIIVIGKQADGTYGIWFKNSSGTPTAKINSDGTISTGAQSFHVFVQTADPAASAVEGDIWIQA